MGVMLRPDEDRMPSEEELAHDFLWRVHSRTPARGMIGIFNRSHYEAVVSDYVQGLCTADVREERFASIRDFERHLARNGTLILKFFLNVSREEQRKRLLDRIDKPDKRWKFSANDLTQRRSWSKYMAAYEEAIRETSRNEAPWYVVPADNKWFTRMVVAAALVEALDRLGLAYPKLEGKALKELQEARKLLESEKN